MGGPYVQRDAEGKPKRGRPTNAMLEQRKEMQKKRIHEEYISDDELTVPSAVKHKPNPRQPGSGPTSTMVSVVPDKLTFI